jgi:non-heme chloroperoxidase
MLKTTANPEGLPIEVIDAIRVTGDRSQYLKDLAIAFYGANRPGAKVSQGTLDQFWLWSMQAGATGASRRRRPDRSGQGLGAKSAKLIKGAKDVYYPGATHGLTATHQDQVNAELLTFIRG